MENKEDINKKFEIVITTRINCGEYDIDDFTFTKIYEVSKNDISIGKVNDYLDSFKSELDIILTNKLGLNG